MGQVENVSVETDPAFDRALKAAVQRGGSDPDAVLNALVEELEITAPLRFSISGLGSGSAGQQGLDVVFQSGTNPNAAANNAATVWLPILRGLEGNGGAYSARASLVEVNGGYILAIGVTVEQPAEEDEPAPVTLTGISVSGCKTEYFVGQSFDPTGMTVTATYSDNSTKTITGITETDKKDVSWDTEKFTNAETKTVTISYGGKTAEVTVDVKISGVNKIDVDNYKNTYTEGESFDPNGMKVTVIYADGKNKIIESITNNGNQGVTWDPAGPLTKEIDSVKITYTDPDQEKGFASANVSVTVQAKPVTLESITVSGTYKTKYISGESFNHTGMTITATYSDGTTKPVTSDYTYSTEPLTEDNAVVTISYGGQSTTVEVTILDGNNSYDAKTKTYSIATADGLLAWNEAAQSDYTLNCTLTENINLTGKEWTPVGNSGQTYNGTFDGQGHTITGLNISSPSEAVALFHNIGGGGKVMNLQLKDVTYNGSTAMGGIAHGNNGTITACSVMGTLTNTTNNGAVGGIAAINYGTITACWFNGTITGGSNVGGIAVFNLNAGSYDGKITACYWSGDGISDGVWDGYDTSGTTKVDSDWTDAVTGMNAALTGNDYQWTSGTDGLPVLQKK